MLGKIIQVIIIRKVPYEEAKDFADDYGMLFKEVSALNTENISEYFERFFKGY